MVGLVKLFSWCSAIPGAVNKLGEVEERLRRSEDSSKENKSALSQLISHTQNVERAVIAGQQVAQIYRGCDQAMHAGYALQKGAAGKEDPRAVP